MPMTGRSARGAAGRDETLAKIRFEFDGISTTVAVPAAPGLRPTLLEVAREHQIPLLFNCEAGACGACIVEIETIGGAPAGMSEAEAFFLAAIGTGDEQGSTGARLACQYRPGADEDICVRFASALCSF
jgi:ferredoxin